MTGTAPQIEWYIGRDGQRHGPISDDEMRKFVELGHLRPTDLVWCPSFTEWKPAAQAFPREPAAAAPPVDATSARASAPQGAPQGAPQPVTAQPVTAQYDTQQYDTQQPAHAAPAGQLPTSQSTTAPSQAIQSAAATTPSSAVVPNPAAPPAQRPQPSPVAATAAHPSQLVSSPLSEDASWAEAMRNVLQPAAPQPARGSGYPGQSVGQFSTSHNSGPQSPAQQSLLAGPSLGIDAAAAHPYTPAIDTAPQAVPSFRHDPAEPTWDEPSSSDAGGFDPPRKQRRDWIAVSAGALAVILVLSGLAWIAWQNRALISGASAIGSALKATVAATPSADAYRLSPYDAPGDTREAIDAALQRTAIWRILKRDHSQWYAERVADIEQRRAQKVDEKVISKFMADVIVTLRRNHALTALQSSPEHLRGMARAFGDNLRQLASRDGSTCFAFITFGEANPFSLELARTPAFAETTQRQMMAIFEAIANGKASRQVHANTRRADYDLLTKDLTARGWSQNDLATFSDPARLSASPPEKVCTLVQEWFATHLALGDPELQSRLLAESLKPLVGG